MILNRLTVVNFGIYRGEKEFDLRPKEGQPVILIGGNNGTGKTTLLEAIRLCLYGPLALDQFIRYGKNEYAQYLLQHIHQSPEGIIPLDLASVELEFEYVLAGERHTYVIKREWQHTPKRLKEKLQVFEDSCLLTDMSTDQWQDFLTELIPPGLSQLFFLDNEKIHTLAIDGVNNLGLTQVIKGLLGLEVVEKLQTDLTIYRRRQQKQGEINSAERQIELLEDELAQAKANLRELETEQTRFATRRYDIECKIKLQEQEIAHIGGGFARQRDEYKASQSRLETEIEQVEQAIRDLCAGLLPFAISPQYANKVKNQLLREAEYQQWLTSKTFIERRVDIIRSEIEKVDFWRGTGAEILVDLQKTVSQRVTATLQRMVDPPEEIHHTELLHQVSEPEQGQLLQWLEESQTTIPDRLQQLTIRLTQLDGELRETIQNLQRVPADDVLAPLVETLNGYNKQFGAIIEQYKQFEEDWRKQELRQEELKRKLDKAHEKKAATQQLLTKIQRVIDVGLVLDDFAANLTKLRIGQLEEVFTRNFNRLCRKDRLIERVTIDPYDFSVTLLRSNGQTLPMDNISAGESQIYTIAMMWALRQISGRPLPVIVDSPLGRLDHTHRQNLVEYYFPQASHQVILFSTDTEFDAEFIEMIQPIVARFYHLEYDHSQNTTIVNKGYFWQANGKTPK
ncbi:MAG: hypothetical protein FOGNACKC_02902 [Anaerolineae bacterium]|nr:hypothetical protein [Anaerolineae bacterium]